MIRGRTWLLTLAVLPLMMAVTAATPVVARDRDGLTAGPRLVPRDRVTVAKAPTSRLARSDAALLRRTDAARVPVLVKLDHDATATYPGGLPGFPATSPSVTGRALARGEAERRYERHLAEREERFVGELRRRVPGATVGHRLRTVYGGLSVVLPANRIRDVAAIPGVVAVQNDHLRARLTDSSRSFIGATAPVVDGAAGRGVIVGVLDSGAWPEHPSFADQGTLTTPPATVDGEPRGCDFGDGFACNRKLIGGRAFLATYLSDPGRAARERFSTARDSDGHGTHTASTAAGNRLTSAVLAGVERGPVSGVAPGAWLSVYKVCGMDGCFSSDSAAAVERAILDGVQVINFSISGGTDPYTDPVELAFLDAYAAGVFVAASAGNDGPAAGTVNHLSPWVTTVAASTQAREFATTLTLRAGDGATFRVAGASITAAAPPARVVLAGSAEGYDDLCSTPAPAGLFTGRIVACQRGGNARVDKGYNVRQGGAAAMILYNPALQDVETDNHWLPTVHLADGAAFRAFLAKHSAVVGSFPAGRAGTGRGDVMAAFSSRGPGGRFLKPDLTAPGVQILAGHTPVPDTTAAGPPGELFQAIAGTSMSGPHVAGAAALLRAVRPDWTPGAVRSALMTTATTAVVKEDLRTPAGPLDFGAGRVRVDVAAGAGLAFDESAGRMAALGDDPVAAVHLNLPSLNAPVMPGRLTTIRRATNVTGRLLAYRVETSGPVDVRPASFLVRPGQTVDLSVTIRSAATGGPHAAEVRLVPVGAPAVPVQHLPVVFTVAQGDVTLASDCRPARVAVAATSTCTVTATNTSYTDASADLATTTGRRLPVTGTTGGAAIVNDHSVELGDVTLHGVVPAVPALSRLPLGSGYAPLTDFDIAAQPIGDEQLLNFDLPAPVRYGGQEFRTLGVASNGYLVVGGGTAEDIVCCDLTRIPDPARPNNVLAPYWTDLDGTGAEGIYAGVLTDRQGRRWVAIEWRVRLFGPGGAARTFQVWLGLNGVEDIVFAYPTGPGASPYPLIVGAENVNGTGGEQLDGPPTADLRVASAGGEPGGSVTYTVTVRGERRGTDVVRSTLDSPQVPGVTVVTNEVRIG